MYWQNAFENWFGRQRSLGLRKDNPSVAEFQYSNNASANQKKFKPITNGNGADSTMIALTDEHFHVENLKKNENLNVNLE